MKFNFSIELDYMYLLVFLDILALFIRIEVFEVFWMSIQFAYYKQAKQLEASIELTRKEMEDPTEVEVELKRRLGQLTDRLIQKQAQVCLNQNIILLFFLSSKS